MLKQKHGEQSQEFSKLDIYIDGHPQILVSPPFCPANRNFKMFVLPTPYLYGFVCPNLVSILSFFLSVF